MGTPDESATIRVAVNERPSESTTAQARPGGRATDRDGRAASVSSDARASVPQFGAIELKANMSAPSFHILA
jgi:hypothetical protein